MAGDDPELTAQVMHEINHDRLMANAKMGTEEREKIDPANGNHKGLGKHKAS